MVAPLLAAGGRVATKSVVRGKKRAQLNHKEFAANRTNERWTRRKEAMQTKRAANNNRSIAADTNAAPTAVNSTSASSTMQGPGQSIAHQMHYNLSNIALKARAAQTSYTVGSIMFGYFSTLQITFFFGALAILAAQFSPVGLMDELQELVTGTDMSQTLMVSLFGLNSMIGIGLICTALLIYYISGVHALSGKMATAKWLSFVVAVAGYMFAPLQWLPTFAIWLWVVARNPE